MDTQNGGEVRVTDRAWFIRLVGEGRIKADTLIFDTQTSLWKRAWELGEYHEALASISSGQAGYAATPYYGAQGRKTHGKARPVASRRATSTPVGAGAFTMYIFWQLCAGDLHNPQTFVVGFQGWCQGQHCDGWFIIYCTAGVSDMAIRAQAGKRHGRADICGRLHGACPHSICSGISRRAA